MESDKGKPRKSSSQKPLNVSRAKIEETRARVHGDMSNEALDQSLISPPQIPSAGDIHDQTQETGGLEDFGGNDGREGLEGSCFEEELGESNLVSSSRSTESDTTLLGFSENAEWVRRNFKRALALAMRDILAKKPSDPIHFLALWLLNYRSAQEKLQLRLALDRELMEERSKIQRSLSASSSKIEEQNIKNIDSGAEIYGEDEENEDSNFQNYID